MLKQKILCSLLALAALASAGKKTDSWKYAGEDHGIRFFFKTKNACQEGPIALKLESTLSIPVEVSFRVMDIDWKKEFAHTLAPNETDSSVVYRPLDGYSACHPYFDRVYLENTAGMAERSFSMSGR